MKILKDCAEELDLLDIMGLFDRILLAEKAPVNPEAEDHAWRMIASAERSKAGDDADTSDVEARFRAARHKQMYTDMLYHQFRVAVMRANQAARRLGTYLSEGFDPLLDDDDESVNEMFDRCCVGCSGDCNMCDVLARLRPDYDEMDAMTGRILDGEDLEYDVVIGEDTEDEYDGSVTE